MADPSHWLGASQTGPRSSFERVRAALEQGGFRVKSSRSNELFSHCPVHDEQTGSLHVTWRPRQVGGGFTLLKCFGCNAEAAVIAEALGLTMPDLFDEPRPEPVRVKSPDRRKAGRRRGKLGRLPAKIPIGPQGPEPDHLWRTAAIYNYETPDGRPVQRVLREECECGGAPHKQFRQEFLHPDGSWKKLKSLIPDFVPVLYNSPAVERARGTGELVHITEGEKDTDRLIQLGCVATTNAEGANSFPEPLFDQLAGLAVWVHVDRDAAGYRRGALLYRALTERGCDVELRMPAVTKPKSDVSDHLDGGLTLDDLVPVSLDELDAWILHDTVVTQARAIEIAIEQAHGQHEKAEAELQAGEEQRRKAKDDEIRPEILQEVEECRRRAHRWVLESQIRQETLRDTAQRVYGQALQAKTSWAFEAMQQSERLLTEMTESARQLHEEFAVAVPESLRSPVGDDEPASGSEPSREEQPNEDADKPGRPAAGGARARWSAFRVLDNQIVQWVPSRGSGAKQSGDEDDDEDEKGSFKTLLSMVVKVKVREYLETDDDAREGSEPELLGRAPVEQPITPRQLVAVRLAYADPLTGETMEIRVPADTWRDHSWLDSLPGAPDYDHRRTGLDQLQRAIIAISDNVEDRVLHTSTGWRRLDDGRMCFVHARGIITAGGHERAGVQLAGSTRRYDWPDPVRDSTALRSAWLGSGWALTERITPRIAVPVMGAAFRAVLGHNPWVVALVGPPGSYKTSVASQVMHFYGERWDRDRPASSMSGNGDTLNAIRYKLHSSQDVLYWMDDFAPTKSWADAQKLLEETARLIHNAEERARSSRDGLSVSDGTGPRAAGLMTSEVMPRPGSAADRMLVVPIAKEDVDPATLFPLSAAIHRHQRALVMASFLSWLSHDHQAKRERYTELANAYAEQLSGSGQSVRQSAALAAVWVGWVAILDFLAAAQALSEQERKQALSTVNAAVGEAGRAAINPDMPRTTGERVRELLGYALRQGIAYVDDVRTGDCPPWPLARQLGWRRTVLESDGDPDDPRPTKVRLDRMGVSLGYVRHDAGPKERDGRVLMCESTQIEAVLRAAGATQTEKLEIDRNTACKALAEAGVLIAERDGAKLRHTKKCELYAEGSTRRMVVLRLDSIIGGLGEDDDDPVDVTPPSTPDEGGGIHHREPEEAPQGASDEQQSPLITPAGGHAVDRVSGAGDTEDVVATDSQAESHQLPDEEDTLGITLVDRDGVVGRSGHPHSSAPCVLCGIVCGMTVDGLRIHAPCWWKSSVAEREAALRSPAPARDPDPIPGDRSPAAGTPTAPAATGEPDRDKRLLPSEKVFRTAAAVAHVDGLWLSDGTMLEWPTPPRHVGDLYEAARRLQLGTRVTNYFTNLGQIWVTAALLESLGVDPSDMKAAKTSEDRQEAARNATRCHAVVTDAVAAGYGIGQDDSNCLGRWTRVWKADSNADAVWIVLIPSYETGKPLDKAPECPFTYDDPDPATLARRIGKLAGRLGFAFQIHPGHTGLDLLKALRLKDRDRFFVPREAVPPARGANEVDHNWSRPPTEEELKHKYVHAYDRGGSHLAGAAGLNVPVGPAEHHPQGRPFDPRVAGYWKLEIPESWDWRMPNPLDPTGQNWGRNRWVLTPTLQFAVERGFEPEILEAWTWSETARVFDPWYERIRDARTALDTDDLDDEVAREQLKQIYTRTIGLMGSHNFMRGKPMYQPERREFIVAKANTNLLRRIAAIGGDGLDGRWPVAVDKDTILYTSNEPDPEKAWPGGAKWFGRGLGQYKPEGSALLADHLRYLTGKGYSGKAQLIKDELS